MKEYIEREAAVTVCSNQYKECLRKSDWCGDTVAWNICFNIKSIPAADVVERKRGEWERVQGDIHSSGYPVRCTECGKYHFVHYRGSLGGLYAHDELFTEPPLCPHCGADMRGEKNAVD